MILKADKLDNFKCIGTKLEENLDLSNFLESLSYMYENPANNTILDLFINDVDLSKIIPVSLEKSNKKSGNLKHM
jgi:hypothetical protein